MKQQATEALTLGHPVEVKSQKCTVYSHLWTRIIVNKYNLYCIFCLTQVKVCANIPSGTMSSISVVDISKVSLDNANPSIDDYKDVGNKVKECFEQIGFLYITEHGISQEIIKNAMTGSMDFFCLGDKIKNKSRKGEEYQGWVEEGREIFDQDEDGKIAEHEVRETYDMKNISSSGIFPDEVSHLL